MLRRTWLAVLALIIMAGVLIAPLGANGDDAAAGVGDPAKIMIVGDSITSGQKINAAGQPTFRKPLYELLDDANYNVDFVGSQSGIDNLADRIDHPDLTATDPDHEGHNGWTIEHLLDGNPAQPSEGRLAEWMTTYQPDVVVWYAGANNFNAGHEPTRVFGETYRAIREMQAVDPTVDIVIVSHHVPTNPVRAAQLAIFNPEVPRFETFSTETSRVLTVDLHTDYPWSQDDSGSHPGAPGQEHIADRIFTVLHNSRLLADGSLGTPMVYPMSKTVSRGARDVDIEISGQNLFAGFTVDAGPGVHLIRTTWDNNVPWLAEGSMTLDIDLWAEPGDRDLVVTNPDGDTTTCVGCLTISTTQVAPPLRVMVVGDEVASGRRWTAAEEPPFRGPLYALISDEVPVEFVGSQHGVGSMSAQAVPIAEMSDLDHEGRELWHVEHLLFGKSGQPDEGTLEEWLDAANPDLVVVVAGHQDARGSQNEADVIAELRLVVDEIRDHNPAANIVVTNVVRHAMPGSPVDNEMVAYNSYFAANKDLAFLDTATSKITTADISGADVSTSTYPSASGHSHIATQIFDAASSSGMLVTPPQPPGPVTGAQATGGAGQMTVQWSGFESAPWVGALTGYSITLSPGGASASVSGSSTSVTFEDLDPDTTYTASIVAQNAYGSGPVVATSATTDATVSASDTDGYWMVRSSGEVFAFGGAEHHGEPLGSLAPGVSAVAIAGHPNGGGYWVLASDGEVFAYGAASLYPTGGPVAAFESGERATTIATHPDGTGYWVFTSRGRVLNHGSAAHFKDLVTLDIVPSQPVIASAATAAGDGYYMVGADGGVFAFGAAEFINSIPGVLKGIPLNQPIVGMVTDPDGRGYYMIAGDGGVFAFEAQFSGSLPGLGVVPVQPIQGMVPFGADGYIAVGGDGGLFSFGSDARYFGSLPDSKIGPFAIVDDVVAVAASYGQAS